MYIFTAPAGGTRRWHVTVVGIAGSLYRPRQFRGASREGGSHGEASSERLSVAQSWLNPQVGRTSDNEYEREYFRASTHVVSYIYSIETSILNKEYR